MKRYSDRKIVIVKRQTRLEEIIVRHNTIEQAAFYIRSLGGDFEDYLEEDRVYQQSIQMLTQVMQSLGIIQILDRIHVPNYVFGVLDIVVVIGQDGLVANTMKYLEDQVIVGVNPDSDRWDGLLLPYSVKESGHIVKEVIDHKNSVKEVSMGKVTLKNGQVLYAVNDFYIGQKSHVSSRYKLQHGKKLSINLLVALLYPQALGLPVG